MIDIDDPKAQRAAVKMLYRFQTRYFERKIDDPYVGPRLRQFDDAIRARWGRRSACVRV